MERAATVHAMLPIPVDLYEIKDEEGFLDELTEATLDAVASGARGIRGLARLVRAGARELDETGELGALLTVVAEARDPVGATLSLPNQAGKLRRKPVLLCIDEAQRLSEVSNDFQRLLHRTLRDSKWVSLLLAGTDDGPMKQLTEDPLGPISALVDHRRDLEPIADDDWRKGLTELFRLGGCSIDSAALERIIAEAKEIGVSRVHSTIAISHHTHLRAMVEGARHIDDRLAMEGFVMAEPDLLRIGRAA